MLFWKKMPSLWVGTKISLFSEIETSSAIAALKIYLTICFFSEEDEFYKARVAKLTYNDFCKISSLSRSLVSEGLKVLYDYDLIGNVSLTPRKKIYTVDVIAGLKDGWCKLPLSGILDEDRRVSAFQSMHNRYKFELVALQVYIYLIYARDNNNEFILARKSTIYKKIKCTPVELNKAITYLVHIGLLHKIEKKNVDKSIDFLFHDSYYFHLKTGSPSALTYRKKQMLDSSIDDDDIPF